MRRSELLALRWQDVDFILSQLYVSRSLHVLKGGNVVFKSPKTAKRFDEAFSTKYNEAKNEAVEKFG